MSIIPKEEMQKIWLNWPRLFISAGTEIDTPGHALSSSKFVQTSCIKVVLTIMRQAQCRARHAGPRYKKTTCQIRRQSSMMVQMHHGVTVSYRNGWYYGSRENRRYVNDYRWKAHTLIIWGSAQCETLNLLLIGTGRVDIWVSDARQMKPLLRS